MKKLFLPVSAVMGLMASAFAEDLVVSRGDPKTINTTVTYEKVTLHDNLTLANGGIVNLANNKEKDSVFVAQDAGDDVTIEIQTGGRMGFTAGQCGDLRIGTPTEGGFGRLRLLGRTNKLGDTFRSHYIVVEAGAVVPAEDNTVIYLGKDLSTNAETLLYTKGIKNNNASPVKVQFAGGALESTDGGAEYWFGGSGTIVLESVNKNLIKFINGGHTYKSMIDGTASLKIVGEGDFFALPASYIDPKYTDPETAEYNYSTDVTGTAGQYDWSEFKGNVVLDKGCLKVLSANLLPCHADCGELKSNSEKSFVDLRFSQKLNGVNCAGTITNASTKLATVTLGSFKDGQLKARRISSLVAFEQVGHTVDVRAANVPSYNLKGGELRIAGSDVFIRDLTLAAGTTVTIDGAVLGVGTLTDNGATITCVNGGRIAYVVTADAGCEGEYLDDVPTGCLVKNGAGTFVVRQSQTLNADAIEVAAGTLALSGYGTQNDWWRVTLTKSKGTWFGMVACLGLFGTDDTGVPVTENTTFVTKSGVDPSTLQPGEIVLDTSKNNVKINRDTTYGTKPDNGHTTTFGADLGVLMKSSGQTGCIFQGVNATGGNQGLSETYPAAITFRRGAGDTTPVTGFSIRTPWNAGDIAHSNRYIYAWMVETSADGVNWKTVMDETKPKGDMKNSSDPWGRWQREGENSETCATPMPLNIPVGEIVAGAKGLKAGADVSVAAGATLDCSQVEGGCELAALTVDLATGGGTLRNVKLAASGTLKLVNAPDGFKKGGFVIPLTFVDSVTAGGLSGWTVTVDGEPIPNAPEWKSGELALGHLGMTVILK